MRQRFVRRHFAPVDTPVAYPRRILISSLSVGRETTLAGHTLLRPAGELESATVPRFRQAIAEIGPERRVVIDMSGVPFLDSCGIGALIGAVRRVRELGGAICIAAVSPPVQRVLSLTGIDRIVDITGTVGEACALLDAEETDAGRARTPVGI